MHQRSHLGKQKIDVHLLKKINNSTKIKTENLPHIGKLVYADESYCEITRNYTSFYGMNILGVVLFLPIVILGLGVTLTFIYYGVFHFDRYAEEFWSDKHNLNITLLFHLALLMIIFMTFVFAGIVNYFIFAPRHYPVRFNRATGKVYVYDYVMYSIGYKHSYTFWWRYPFYKRTYPQCKEYDWNQIQGIMVYSRNKYSSNSTIRCIVYDSSISTTVIDSFNLISTDAATDSLFMYNYKLWLWVCNYMHFNDAFLDMTVNADVGIYGREVKWPDEMDKKSRASSL